MKKLAIIAAFIIIGCGQKEKEVIGNDVSFYAYSEKGKFTFKHVDVDQNWHDTLINSNTLNLDIKQVEENYGYGISLISDGPDSVYISAISDGKKAESSYRSTVSGTIRLIIQLTELK